VTAFDFETGERKYQLRGHNDFVSSLCLSPDSRLIATGSGADRYQPWDGSGGEVKLWDLQTGELVQTIMDRGGNVRCLAFDSRGQQLAIGRDSRASDPQLFLWRVSTGTELQTLQPPASKAIHRSPNGIGQANPLRNLGQPHSLAFSPDDKLLAVGGRERLSLWNMPGGELRYVGQINGPVQDLQFSSDGKKLYLSMEHLYEVQISQLSGKRALAEQVFRPTTAGVYIGEFAMAVNGRWIASCPKSWHVNGGEISLWDVDRKELQKVVCHDGVRSVDVTPSGRLVTGSVRPERFVTTILDPKNGRTLARSFHQSERAEIEFIPGGELFATPRKVPRSTKLVRHRRGYLQAERTSSVAGIDLWDTRTGRKLAELSHQAATSFHFSPDGKVLASVGPANVKLWQISKLSGGDTD